MKNLLLAMLCMAMLSACQSDKKTGSSATPEGIHTIVIQEVLQTGQYTYLRVKDGDAENWLALPKTQANAGETYYYKGGMMMHNFESKELNKSFPEILFIDNLSKSPEMTAGGNASPAGSGSPSEAVGVPGGEGANANAIPATHTIVAEEVLQTTQYTYIRGKEDGRDLWLAVAKMKATTGATYHFTGGLPMTNFQSKELKKTFPEILFVDNISSETVGEKNTTSTAQATEMTSKGSAIDLEKKEIRMTHAPNDITIAKLLENKKSFAGKSVKIKGQVTKYTPGVMKRNWIHLQDGTEYSGKFDLTLTTDEEVNVGDNITAEGVIAIDKDFGYGYYYEVLMENAKISK